LVQVAVQVRRVHRDHRGPLRPLEVVDLRLVVVTEAHDALLISQGLVGSSVRNRSPIRVTTIAGAASGVRRRPTRHRITHATARRPLWRRRQDEYADSPLALGLRATGTEATGSPAQPIIATTNGGPFCIDSRRETAARPRTT